MSKLTYRWAARYLPLPEPLKSAVDEGFVFRSFAPDGQALFTIAPDTPGQPEILQAIQTHSTWQLWVAQAEQVLIGAALAGLVWAAVGR